MKRSEIERLIPTVLRRTADPGNPLGTLLEVMEAHHAPVEEILSGLPLVFSPRSAPVSFVPLLATWVDLDWLWRAPGRATLGGDEDGDRACSLSCGPGRIRDLVAAAAELSRWRGTARGLCSFLELATGIQGVRVDEQVSGSDGRHLSHHIRVRIPGKASHRALIERIVEEEKPAYVTFELSFEEPEA